jgi:hypothetical protein
MADGNVQALRTIVTIVCTLAAAWLLWGQNRRSGSGLIAALLALPEPIIPRPPDPDRPVALTLPPSTRHS